MRSMLLRLVLAAMTVAALMTAEASAQSRPNFLERLFGGERQVAPPADIPNAGPRQRAPARAAPSRAAPTQQRKKPAAAAPAEPTYPALEIAPKEDDARKILVIGDFVAGGLAWGLDQAFATDPATRIIDRSEGSSGLVRDDHYDWTASLPELIEETTPDAVVVMIGINDRQPIRGPDGNFALRSDAWDAAYGQRVERFVAALKAAGRPVVWIGEPPVRSAEGSADMAFLNSLFKDKAEAAGMRFVDIWDGFAGEDGKFVARGPDIDGQVRQLRSGDGINFTRSGRRKLAFFAERGLGSASAGPGLAAPLNPSETIEIGADGRPRTVGPVISLTDPAAAGAGQSLAGGPPPSAAPTVSSLAGASPPAGLAGVGPAGAALPALEPPSPVEQLTTSGVAPPAPPGRADDFTWKPPLPTRAAAPGGAVDGVVILPAAAPAATK